MLRKRSSGRFVKVLLTCTKSAQYRGEVAQNAQEADHKMSALDWSAALEDIELVANHARAAGAPAVAVTGFCMGIIVFLFLYFVILNFRILISKF